MSPSAKILFAILSAACALGAILFLTGAEGRQVSAEPKYHVVITRPLKIPGWRAKELYRTDELMTDVFNEIEREGLIPIYFQVFEAGTREDFTESRAMIVCKPR